MTLRVTTSNVEPDIVVLHLSGTTTIGPETDALELLVRDLLNRSSRLVFDLAGVRARRPTSGPCVPYLDSRTVAFHRAEAGYGGWTA
jgi:hypothetical protein